MSPAGWLVGLALLVLIAGLVVYWLLIITEGAYLGPSVVTTLYDRFAHRYDAVKGFDPQYERYFLADPVVRFLEQSAGAQTERLWVLDVGAGTGRLAQALVPVTGDEVSLICLDRSLPMLRIAQQKLAAEGRRELILLAHDAAFLPFPDDSFAVVACLEALEFTADPRAVLADMVRVARPGGMLLLTNRIGWQARLFPGKRFRREHLATLLREQGCGYIDITPWQVDYQRVLALKAGEGSLVNRAAWSELLLCPWCGGGWQPALDDRLEHRGCAARASRSDGIWQFFNDVRLS